jgi:hypothetical protein
MQVVMEVLAQLTVAQVEGEQEVLVQGVMLWDQHWEPEQQLVVGMEALAKQPAVPMETQVPILVAAEVEGRLAELLYEMEVTEQLVG